MEFEDSKQIVKESFDFNRAWKVKFEFYRNYNKQPLTKEEFNQINEELISVFEKHNMSWKQI